MLHDLLRLGWSSTCVRHELSGRPPEYVKFPALTLQRDEEIQQSPRPLETGSDELRRPTHTGIRCKIGVALGTTWFLRGSHWREAIEDDVLRAFWWSCGLLIVQYSWRFFSSRTYRRNNYLLKCCRNKACMLLQSALMTLQGKSSLWWPPRNKKDNLKKKRTWTRQSIAIATSLGTFRLIATSGSAKMTTVVVTMTVPISRWLQWSRRKVLWRTWRLLYGTSLKSIRCSVAHGKVECNNFRGSSFDKLSYWNSQIRDLQGHKPQRVKRETVRWNEDGEVERWNIGVQCFSKLGVHSGWCDDGKAVFFIIDGLTREEKEHSDCCR